MLHFMDIVFLVRGVTSDGRRHLVQCLAGHQKSLQLEFQCSQEKCHSLLSRKFSVNKVYYFHLSRIVFYVSISIKAKYFFLVQKPLSHNVVVKITIYY